MGALANINRGINRSSGVNTDPMGGVNHGAIFDRLYQQNPALAYQYGGGGGAGAQWYQQNQNQLRNQYFGGDQGKWNDWVNNSAYSNPLNDAGNMQTYQSITGTAAGGAPLSSVGQPGHVGTPGVPGSQSQQGMLDPQPYLDPSMQFRMDQGTKALQNSAAARGGLLSGNTMRGIEDYAQGLASTEYGNAWNRAFQDRGYNTNVDQWNAQFNRSGDQWDQTFNQNAQQFLANNGLQATQANMNLLATLAALQNSNIIGGGNAGAAGTIGGNNAINDLITQLLTQFNLGNG